MNGMRDLFELTDKLSIAVKERISNLEKILNVDQNAKMETNKGKNVSLCYQ